jgi:hypothetical protein
VGPRAGLDSRLGGPRAGLDSRLGGPRAGLDGCEKSRPHRYFVHSLYLHSKQIKAGKQQ